MNEADISCEIPHKHWNGKKIFWIGLRWGVRLNTKFDQYIFFNSNKIMDCSFNISTQKGNHCYQNISAQADNPWTCVILTAEDAPAILHKAKSIASNVGHHNPQKLLEGLSMPDPDIILWTCGKKLGSPTVENLIEMIINIFSKSS